MPCKSFTSVDKLFIIAISLVAEDMIQHDFASVAVPFLIREAYRNKNVNFEQKKLGSRGQKSRNSDTLGPMIV